MELELPPFLVVVGVVMAVTTSSRFIECRLQCARHATGCTRRYMSPLSSTLWNRPHALRPVPAAP